MRFFIYCPAHFATGGTELLHQFSQCLSNNHIENYLIYDELPINQSAPTPERFQKYDVKYVRHYVDNVDSVLVLPETRIKYMDLCKKGQIMIWWLSVDNYSSHLNNELDIFDIKSRENVTNFWQSLYAEDFLRDKMGIPFSIRLMDYINDEIINIGKLMRQKIKRENICLYNPKKGYNNLRPIIEKCRKDIRWIAVEGLSPQEAALLFCRSKVYIDFGHHPGKDRMPREAAVCGVGVITNTMGSAGYDDVSIPDKYKVQDMQDTEHVLDIIYNLTDNFDDCKADFEDYINIIENERKQFDEDVKNVIEYYRVKFKSVDMRQKQKSDYNDIFIFIDEIISRLKNNFIDMCSPETNTKLSEVVSLSKAIESDYLVNLLHEAIWAMEDDMVN